MEAESFIFFFVFSAFFGVCFLCCSSFATVKEASVSFIKQMLDIKTSLLPARKENGILFENNMELLLLPCCKVMPLKNYRSCNAEEKHYN